MSATSFFRAILIANLLLVIIGIIAGITLADTLPPALREYRIQVDGDVSKTMAMFSLMVILLYVVLLPLTLIGLWFFKSWARALYVFNLLISIPLYPAMGAVIMTSWEAMFHNLSLTISGVFLAMMFSGEVGLKFSKKKVPADA